MIPEGGFKMGQLTTICGDLHIGREGFSTMAYMAAAEALNAGKPVIFLDYEASFDTEAVDRMLGIQPAK